MKPGARILIVEDDRTLRETLADALTQDGYDVTSAADGRAATDLVFSRSFRLVLLDVMLPARSGFEILREMRANGIATPVLMLTVRGDESDKVLGFDLGADDYVTKPFSLRELLARVRALLRRGPTPVKSAAAAVAHAPDLPPERFAIGDARVDLGAYRIVRAGATHPLSPREAAILVLLVREAGRVVSRDRFLDEVWGEESLVGHRTIDTHILNLRQKIERDPSDPVHLLTVHGVGYRLVLDPAKDEAPRRGERHGD